MPRGLFALEEPAGERWELALDLFRRGEAFTLGGVTFRRLGSGLVEAVIASAWLPENLTEALARQELAKARALVERLRSDAAFREALSDSRIDLVLVDDYQTGSAALCRMASDQLEWLIPRP